MQPNAMVRLAKLVAIAALLAASISSYRLVPFHKFWGLDLQNHLAFHTCFAKDNPYLATGGQCHDDGWRDMYYPPLLYFSFAWTRLCTLPTAIRIWSALIGLGTLGSLLFWLRRRQRLGSGRIELAVFGLLLLAQFPVVFAIERGNSDVIILAMWTLAMALFRSGRIALAGFVAGLSAATKLYPVFGCLVTGVGLIGLAIRDRSMLASLGKFLLGGVIAVAAAVLAFLPQTRAYLSDELPRYAAEVTPLFVYSHSLQHVFPEQKWIAYLLFGALLIPWIVAAARSLKSDPELIFAGGLAIATYYAATSYDYNLLVTYPLLVLLFARGIDRERPSMLAFALCLAGLFAVIGPRSLFDGSDTLKKAHILLQWAWLLAAGIGATWLAERQHARVE